MDLGGIMEIDDGVANHLVVRNVEVNGVIGAQSSRTPIDLHHLSKTLTYLQPVADFVWTINLDRYATNNAGKKILTSEAEDNCDHSRTREQTFQLRFGMIAVAQNQQQYDQKNDPTDNLTEKMRDWRVPLLFEIKIPYVSV